LACCRLELQFVIAGASTSRAKRESGMYEGKLLALRASSYTILQMVSVTTFEKIPLDQLLNLDQHNNIGYTEVNQLNLFDD
jgi:hypothetical protein